MTASHDKYFDATCIVCGCCLQNLVSADDDETLSFSALAARSRREHPEYNWLNNVTLVASDGRVLRTTSSKYDHLGCFKGIPGARTTFVVAPALWHTARHGRVCAVAVHRDCCSVLRTDNGYNVTFDGVSDLLRTRNDMFRGPLYAPLDRCAVFPRYDFRCVLRGRNRWCLSSPVHEPRNRSRIVSNWGRLVKETARK